MSDVLDRAAVLTHFGGDSELVQEIAGLFRDSSQEWLGQLRDALARGDADQVRRVAHTLKGSAANFLARDVSAAALELEKLGRAGNLAAAPAALAALELQVEGLRSALETWVRELRGGA